MPNITLSIDEKTLKESREYAHAHRTSLNALVRELLRQRVGASSGEGWAESCFAAMDRLNGNSRGEKWTRDDIYDV